MAYDFLGTFNKSQFERFIAFAKSQLTLVEGRLRHLEFELIRTGTVSFSYDAEGQPTAFQADPLDSYVGKLVAAYEVMGGNPFCDLRVRQTTQSVFVLKASEQDSPQLMSDGSVIGARGLADGASAETIRRGRDWIDDTMKVRFDRLERKIRRAVDYADQLQAEINRLEIITAAASVDGSLEEVEASINELLGDTGFRAIYDDGGTDPCGLKVYSPYSSYDIVPSGDPNIKDRKGTSHQRQNSGLVGPGEKGGQIA